MFSLVVFVSILAFFLFHKLDIWPLPVPIRTLISETTTLLFFVEIGTFLSLPQHEAERDHDRLL